MQRQVIVELDSATSAELERIAPSRNRKRSDFIRAAIRRALDEAAEKKMAEAYRQHPDSATPPLDPRTWEQTTRRPGRGGKNRKA